MTNTLEYNRNYYINSIKPFISKPVIKVITGMRRVGKSTFIRLLIKHLLDKGYGKKQILHINKEIFTWEHLQKAEHLYREVEEYFSPVAGDRFIFLDEVQLIDGWEKAVNSFLAEGKYDIYITGSNAGLLSSDLATLISGRYIEFPLFPLNLDEFILFRKKNEDEAVKEFPNFLRYGGFPGIHFLEFESEYIYQYLNALYHTILLKDVIKRNSIRNIALLEDINRFIFDNIGNIVSIKRIADYFKSLRRIVDHETVRNYIRYLESGFLVYKVPRYDLKRKRFLEFYDKYFIGDIGLRHALLGFKEQDISGLLENLVFLKLKQLGYKVYFGKLDNWEINFIAEKNKDRFYIQVCYMLSSEKAAEREFSSLLRVDDNYSKYVISMDTVWQEGYKGVKHIHLIDFFLKGL